MRKTILSGAIALSLFSLNIDALSVGEMSVNSRLGEPLNVSIVLDKATKGELSTLVAALASRDAFAEAGILYPDNASDLTVEVDTSKKGQPKILVKSINSISDPFVHLLLKISWAGGNMLREYTALIDPSEYDPQPLTNAAAANTKLGIAKPATRAKKVVKTGKENTPKAKVDSAANATAKVHGKVKSGDSLSSIASLYRPSNVSVHQAWIAFFKLNPKAFPDSNLNRIEKGSDIQVPTLAQMTAISQSKAAKEVKALSKPLVETAKAKPSAPKAAPKLVVGTEKKQAPAAKAAAQQANAKAEPAPKETASNRKDEAAAVENAKQLASVSAEFQAFKEDASRQMDQSREQNAQFKEQLVASSGENRVLKERIAELEVQLGNVSRLLEIQGEAMQAAMEADEEKNQQMAVESLADNAEGSKTEDDKSSDDAMMAANIESSAVNPPASDTAPSGADTTTETSSDVSNNEQAASETMAALNSQAQEKIAQSEQRINSLEKELDEKIALAQGQAQDAMSQSSPTQERDIQASAEPQAAVDNEAEPAVEQTQAGGSFIDKGMGMLAGISADVWKIIGVAAAALLGLFLFSGARRQRAEQLEDDDSYSFSTLEDLAMQDQTDVTNNNKANEQDAALASFQAEDQAQGSSLFDLSDESFMASEAVENESSLFAMDEEFGSFGKMASGATSGSSTLSNLQASIPDVSDVDPLTEADVYLAYDRTEQAVKVLEQALVDNPNQGKIVVKLLSIYKDANNTDAFTKVFESSVENVEDDEQWGNIKGIALEFIPGHKFVDDFDSSIPVLRDELVDEQQQPESNDGVEIDAIDIGSDEDDEDDLLNKAMLELENETKQGESEPPAFSLDDDIDISIEDEMKVEATNSLSLEDEEVFTENEQVLNERADDIDLDIALEQDQDIDETLLAQTLEQELDSEMEEVNQYDPETALALAKAYIELGENDIAKDFLNDVIGAGGSQKVKGEAEQLLAAVS